MSEAKEHEEYVRSRWEWFASFDLSDEEDREDNDPEWLVQVCDASAGNPIEFYGATEAEAWSAAYAFTKEREEQIRQIENCLILLECCDTEELNDQALADWQSIIAREQAALAELRKGMRQ